MERVGLWGQLVQAGSPHVLLVPVCRLPSHRPMAGLASGLRLSCVASEGWQGPWGGWMWL